MFWPDTQTGVDVEPARKTVQSAVRKYFTEGGVGVPPTVPGGDWFNQITNELLNLLAAANIDPSKIEDDQILKAIKRVSNSTSAREALRRSYAEAGYTLVEGSFEVGGTLTSTTDVLLYEANGKAYSWTGLYPGGSHQVGSDSSPIVDPLYASMASNLFRYIYEERMAYTPKQFNTVADMIASASSLNVGDVIICHRFYSDVPLPSPNNYKVTTDVPDGMFVLDLGNGLSATLHDYSRQLFIERIGAKPDLYIDEISGTLNPNPTDNWAFFDAIKTRRAHVLAFGAYFIGQKLDLGNDDTEKFGSLRGLVNRNFDGWQSVLAFSGTDGIEVFAGADLQDFTLKGLATKTGVGLIGDNVHGANIRNVTAINFAQGFSLHLWTSQCERLIAYQCTSGIRITNESTSTTYSSCYSKDCGTGFDLGGFFTYSTLMNCASDNCDVPYLFRGGSNVDLSNCGAEISHANIDGFFRFETVEAPATVSISGGRFIMLAGKTCDSIVYAPVGAPNSFGIIQFSRINTNSFTNPVSGFVKGNVRALISDGCVFNEPFNLRVAPGSNGILLFGFANSSGAQYAIRTPSVAGVNTADQPIRHKIVVERYIDFAQAKAAGHSVYLLMRGVAADSILQVKVESYPAGPGGLAYQEWRAWMLGGNGGSGVNVVGTQFSSSVNNSDGYRCMIFNRDAQPGRAFVRVTVEGMADSAYRDVLFSLIVGPIITA